MHRTRSYSPFATWSDVRTFAAEGRRILYQAPLDRGPCDVRPVKLYKNGKIRVSHVTAGKFTIDETHLDRMLFDPSDTKPRFTLGCTPAALITRLCSEQCPDGYPMTLRSQAEWTVVRDAWNQGIDSHLEALTERSSADSSTGEVLVHPEELHVLLRRLFEAGDECTGWSLRSDILSTIGVEEI